MEMASAELQTEMYSVANWLKPTGSKNKINYHSNKHVTLQAFRNDPNYRIAIAEGREGDNEPVIVLYTWPQLEIDAVLREGTENAYSMLDFR